jgi:uncharacterized membrane protein
MIALAVGLGVLGIFALRRARRRCYAGGYGWYGPWADYGAAYGSYHGDDDGDGDDEHGANGEHDHGERPHDDHGHGGHRWHGGPPWMHGRRGGPWGRHGGRGRGGRGGRGGWGGRRGRWMLHAALSRIDATPAQERVIVGEIERLQERMRDARTGMRDMRGDLAAALRGPVLDDAALGAVLGRVDGATGEARAAALDALRNIHAVLDEKQRAMVADMIERRGGRDRGRRGGGGGGAGWFRMGPYR